MSNLKDDKKKGSGFGLLGWGISLTIEMVIAVVLGALGGNWADNKFGTNPWLMIIGFIIGVIAGFRNLYITMIEMEHKQEKRG